MKQITEYNFRDIVGHFVKIRFPRGENPVNPEWDEFIAYVYIDTEAGMTLEIIGGYYDGKISKVINGSTKVRYGEGISLELYEKPDEEMLKTAKFIEDIYTPDWIGQIRNDPVYDPFRDKQYPDDMLLLVATFVDEKMDFERLWVRPVNVDQNDNVLGKTIEAGRTIAMGADVAIMSNKVLGGKTIFDLPDIIAIDEKMADFLANRLREISGD